MYNHIYRGPTDLATIQASLEGLPMFDAKKRPVTWNVVITRKTTKRSSIQNSRLHAVLRKISSHATGGDVSVEDLKEEFLKKFPVPCERALPKIQPDGSMHVVYVESIKTSSELEPDEFDFFVNNIIGFAREFLHMNIA